jgi:putative transposase
MARVEAEIYRRVDYMVFWRCYYHFIWTTKERQPLLTPQHEIIIFDLIRGKTQTLHSRVLAINAASDHIHVAVTLHPNTAISDWVKLVKGASSHAANTMLHTLPDQPHFGWQRGYGVLTFGAKVLPTVIQYIENQKQHHADGTLQPYLERVEPD